MSPSADKTKGRVFLVDDHALVREWLTTLINQQPDLVACGEAANVPEALEGIAAAKPDVAVVDLSLEGASGVELIARLKLSHPGLGVLVLTMHEETRFAERALGAGAKGYLTKREATKKIIEAIRKVRGGELYFSAHVAQKLAARFLEGDCPAGPQSVERLSAREREVFELLGQAQKGTQIAQRLGIDVKTVHTYCTRIREKLKLDSSVELLREAFRWHDKKPQ
jgi:DNA-binding NarL/FixJ family response regulator